MKRSLSFVVSVLALAGCGARTNLDDAPTSAGGAASFGSGEPTASGGATTTPTLMGNGPAPIPKGYPCTGSGPMVGGYSVDDTRAGSCAWQSAEVPDPTKPVSFYDFKGAISLTFVSGPDDCARVGGLGWFRLPTVPGKIADAPVKITIGVCPEACKMIGPGWGFAFSAQTCRS